MIRPVGEVRKTGKRAAEMIFDWARQRKGGDCRPSQEVQR